MINTAMSCALVVMAGKTVGRVVACSDDVHHRLRCAVVTGGAGPGTIGRNIVQGRNLSQICRCVTDTTGGSCGFITRTEADSMEVAMAVEVVRRVTLAAVTGRCRWSVGGGTVTNCTAVVLLDICSVDEVDVINGGCVTAVTFALQCHQAGVVLGGMGCEVRGDPTVTL